jgi:hypothetical protein
MSIENKLKTIHPVNTVEEAKTFLQQHNDGYKLLSSFDLKKQFRGELLVVIKQLTQQLSLEDKKTVVTFAKTLLMVTEPHSKSTFFLDSKVCLVFSPQKKQLFRKN